MAAISRVDGVDRGVPAGRAWSAWSAPTARARHADQCPGRLVARRAAVCAAACGWPASRWTACRRIARAARGLVLVPEGKGIFADLTVTENLALVRPPADTAGRHVFSMDEIYDLFPRLRERRTTGSACCRAASGRWWPSAARSAPARGCCCSTSRRSGLAPRLVYELLQTMRQLVDRRAAAAAGRAERPRATLELVDELCSAGTRQLVAEGPVAEMQRRPAHPRGLSGGQCRMNLAAAVHQRADPRPCLCADRDRLDRAAGRGAAGEFRPWPDVYAGRLPGLVGDGLARLALSASGAGRGRVRGAAGAAGAGRHAAADAGAEPGFHHDRDARLRARAARRRVAGLRRHAADAGDATPA